jgi:hypothetical protein
MYLRVPSSHFFINIETITDPRESRGNANNGLNTNNLLTKFLEEFKAMFQQLTQQNMTLNMLSTLISKIH